MMRKGGRPLTHLDLHKNDKPFLSPAIIDVTDVQERSDVELFGPILQVIRVPDFDAALAEAGATRFGLAASLVGGSPQLYDKFWANIRAGVRSEEHTSELQSLMRISYAVFCLKKKTK